MVVKEIKYWLESYFFLVSCIYDFIHNLVLFLLILFPFLLPVLLSLLYFFCPLLHRTLQPEHVKGWEWGRNRLELYLKCQGY